MPLLDINRKQSKLKIKKEKKSVAGNPSANNNNNNTHNNVTLIKPVDIDSVKVPREEPSKSENAHLGAGDREIEKFVLVQQTFGSEKQNDSGNLKPNIEDILFKCICQGILTLFY